MSWVACLVLAVFAVYPLVGLPMNLYDHLKHRWRK